MLLTVICHKQFADIAQRAVDIHKSVPNTFVTYYSSLHRAVQESLREHGVSLDWDVPIMAAITTKSIYGELHNWIDFHRGERNRT